MRLLAVLLALLWTVNVPFEKAWAAEISFPPLTGRVVDQAHVLSPAAVQALSQKLADHDAATHQQVVVATVASLQGREIADYGYQLGRAWGIGEKDKNTGAILLVAAFGIYNIISTVVHEKTRDIAILKSLGFAQRDILAIFLAEGVIVGILGGIAGAFVGMGLIELMAQVRFGTAGTMMGAVTPCPYTHVKRQ